MDFEKINENAYYIPMNRNNKPKETQQIHNGFRLSFYIHGNYLYCYHIGCYYKLRTYELKSTKLDYLVEMILVYCGIDNVN